MPPKGNIADATYSSLPAIGEEDPAKLALAATIANTFRLESATQRNKFTGNDSELLNNSQNIYHFGREDGFVGDTRPTINRAKKTLDAFEASACRTSSSITLKSSSIHEDGFWVLKKPFSIPPKLGPDGQPIADPITGIPHQPIPLQLYEPIPDETVDIVPQSYRVCINTETVVAWEQINFDILRREIEFDDVVHNFVHIKQIAGWVMALFEWDPISQRPLFKFFPPQQWYPDPIKSDVKDMNRLGLDMIVDTEEAKRYWPQATEAINASAAKSVKYAPGAMGYSDLYVGNTLFATPIVTVSFTWLRNQEVPMNLAEAHGTGFVTISEAPEEQSDAASAEEAQTATKAGDGDAGEETAEGDQGAEQEDTEANGGDAGEGTGGEPGVAPKRTITHAHTKEDLSSSFKPDGSPSDELHPNHPHKLITLQWIQIDSKVVPGTYVECPHWDIPVVLDKNSEVMFRPFAYPETLTLASPQATINSMHESMVTHAQYFKGPAGFLDRSVVEKIDGGFKDGHAEPGKIFTYDSGGDPNFDIKKYWQNIEPPAMSTALPQVFDRINQDYEKIADAGVNNGTPPPDVKSGRAIAALQSASQNTNDLKSRHTEKAIRRCVKLWLHGQIHWLTIDEIMKFNRKLPREIVERYIMPFRKQILWDVDVSLPTGAGQVKQQKDAEIRADFAAGLVDQVTAQEEIGYDSENIARNRKVEREEMAEEQAEAAAKAAPQQQPQQTESLSINYKDAPPSVRRQMEQLAGFNPATDEENKHQVAAMKPKEATPQPVGAGQ